ncbi:hypothetical protein V6N12_026099 [Hibiscus sabdariffa]|uniref:Sodium/calcium exchanger membrane region domain-containing protein n=1 Tax=Hibiscus sabdariffa TaxID=183260 RepID=A0ABR2DQS3_9ROSI
MSPTVAGVTLLPLGNGAPYLFASIAAFSGMNSGEVGINRVLGGAVFVTCVVVGIISLCIAEKRVQIDSNSFVRDLGFFMCLLLHSMSGDEEGDTIYAPLLESGSKSDLTCVSKIGYHNRCGHLNEPAEDPKPTWVWNDEETLKDRSPFSCCKFLSLLELPLSLPRRLTIPMVEERWSKVYAVASATLAPMLLAFLWNTQDNDATPLSQEIVYFIGVTLGGILGSEFLHT